MPRPPYFFFQLQNVASLMPILRQTSATVTPVSAWQRAKTIWNSVNLDFFIAIGGLGGGYSEPSDPLL